MRSGGCRIALLLGVVLLCSAPALDAAPTPGQTPQANRRGERPVIMSEGVYNRLAAVHELLGRQDNDEALSRLAGLERMRLSPYESALVYQAYGYVYVNLNQPDRALEYFEKCRALDALPGQAQQGMLYSMAGLYAAQGRHPQAIAVLEEWFAYESEPVPDAYVLMASNLYQLGRFEQALDWVGQAIARQRSLGEPARESWYQLQLAILFELEKFAPAAALLQEMIAAWPQRAGYWKSIAGIYSRLGQDRQALAYLFMAYQWGHLTGEADLLSLASLQLYLGQPQRAGQLLETEMAAGHLARDRGNLELLLQARRLARDDRAALAVLDELATLDGGGRFHLEKARLLLEAGNWHQAAEAAERALQAGGLSQPGEAWLLRGMALAESGEQAAAEQALREARKLQPGEVARRAEGWLEYLRERRLGGG